MTFRNALCADVVSVAPAVISRNDQRRRALAPVVFSAVEGLESRILLSYSTSSYSVNASSVGSVKITDSAGANTNLVVFAQGGFLAHTGDGNTGSGAGEFASSLDWNSAVAGVQKLAASSTSSLSINENNGTDTTTLGTSADPADLILAPVTVSQAAGNHSKLTINDSGTSAVSTYTYNGSKYTGPGGNVVNVSVANSNGLYILGGSGNDTFNLTGSTGNDTVVEPVNLVGGRGDNTVNIGSSGTLANINGPVYLTDPTGFMTANINDQSDKTYPSVLVTSNTITGLSPAVINYAGSASAGGFGVNSLVINGGPGLPIVGVEYDVDSTDPGVSLTLNMDSTSVVNLGAASSMDEIGPVNLINTAYFYALTLDDAADTVGRNVKLAIDNDANTASITGLSPGPITFLPGDVTAFTVDGGSGGNTFDWTNTVDGANNVLTCGAGNDTVIVTAVAPSSTLFIHGQGGTDTVKLGGSMVAPLGASDLLGDVDIDNAGGTTNLIVDDSQDTSSPDTSVPANIAYVPQEISKVTILRAEGSNGGTYSYNALGAAVTVTAGAVPGEVIIGNPPAAPVNLASYNVVNITDFGDANPSGTPLSVGGAIGQSTGTVKIAEFHSTIPGVTAADFTGRINFGDGTPVINGQIVQDTTDPTLFYVESSHTYSAVKNYVTSTLVRFIGATTTTVINGVTVHFTTAASGNTFIYGSAMITQPPLVPTVDNFTVLQGRLFSGTVATFHDDNSKSGVANLSATIRWGDGQMSTATIVSTGAGNFKVTGSHTYSSTGSYTAKVTIADTDGAVVSINDTAAVTVAPLINATSASFSVAANTTFTNHLLGSFTDEDAVNTNASVYANSTINWGDGSAATHPTFARTGATANVGSFWKVLGTHKYTTKGIKHVTITLEEGTAAPLTLTLTITVT